MKCANCGTESNGRFCPSCGTELRTSSCVECGAELPPGARFCTRCGTATAAAAGRTSRTGASGGTSPNLPWYIAGAVLVVLILILLVPMLTDRDDAGTQAPFTPGTMNGATPGAPPPLTGTPREQADRLFNRIMTAWGQGDTAQARQFAPMAIDAYGMAAPLDLDGLYHLAAVHIVSGNYDEARRTAAEILASEPGHLLALSAAAEAAALDGDSAAARAHYQHLLRVFDTESVRSLQEYLDHSRQLPQLRETARRFTGS